MPYEKFNNNPFGSHIKGVQLVGKSKKVLEVGCATGYISKRLVENDCEVYGIELDPEAAKIAKKYCKKVFVGDAETLKLDEKFDVILILDVLEHLKNPGRLLLKLKEYLNQDGYFVLSIPNIANWKIRLKLLIGKFDYEDDGILDKNHLRFFTLKSAKRMVENAGLEIFKLDIVPSAPLPFEMNPSLHKLKYEICKLLNSLFSFQFLISAKEG